MTLQFRIADHGDFDGIWAVLMDGKAALGRLGIDQWQGAYPTQQIVRDDIEAGHSYVLEEDGVVVATTVIGFTGEPVYDAIEGAWLTGSDSRDPRYAVLHRVAVAQGHAGKGLGRKLLQSAEPVACQHGYESLRIETHPGNVPMLKLIERCGFTRCGIVHISHAEGASTDRVAFEKVL